MPDAATCSTVAELYNAAGCAKHARTFIDVAGGYNYFITEAIKLPMHWAHRCRQATAATRDRSAACLAALARADQRRKPASRRARCSAACTARSPRSSAQRCAPCRAADATHTARARPADPIKAQGTSGTVSHSPVAPHLLRSTPERRPADRCIPQDVNSPGLQFG